MPKMPFAKRREKGQVLLIALVVLVILALAIFFIFDLSSTVKLKIRGQTGVDAAALVGAKWQMHGLNLIGELNLIKASTALIYDFDPVSDLAGEDIAVSDAILAAMQVEVSFACPLLGLGAMQQAAKNNKLYNDPGFAEILEDHISLLSDPNSVYSLETQAPRLPVNPRIRDHFFEEEYDTGYEWKPDYIEMLRNIAAQGMAVSCNTTFTDITISDASFLQNRSWYRHVNSSYWCGLIGELRMAQSNPTIFEGAWWRNFDYGVARGDFIGQSEYIPLYVSFSTGGYYQQAAGDDGEDEPDLLRPAVRERGMVPLDDEYDYYHPTDSQDEDGKISPYPWINWAVYGGGWRTRPSDQWDEWFESPLREEFKYGGAVTVAHVSIRPANISGAWGWEYGSNPRESRSSTIGSNLPDAGTGYGARMSEAESRFDMALEDVSTSALAKPLGYFDTEGGARLNPTTTNMVLPVFKQAVMMPVAFDPRGMDEFLDWAWFLWVTKILPQIGSHGSLESFASWVRSNYGNGYDYYLAALSTWSNPQFRERGWTWLDIPVEGRVVDGDGVPRTEVIGINEDFCFPPAPPGGAAPPSGPSPSR